MGQSAHDTFWGFVSLMPESTHMVLWAMSDRAFPRHYRNMEGFGVHSFRLIDKEGTARFVKFHWKPVAGTCSLVWDEAQKLGGRDPDFNRRAMWNDIENGDFLEYELGIQVVKEADEHAFDFDILDPTKIIPEEQVPVTLIGKLVLNRNPDNFFAETEQVAFNPGHIVLGSPSSRKTASCWGPPWTMCFPASARPSASIGSGPVRPRLQTRQPERWRESPLPALVGGEPARRPPLPGARPGRAYSITRKNSKEGF